MKLSKPSPKREWLKELLARAREQWAAMSEEERKKLLQLQAESWARQDKD